MPLEKYDFIAIGGGRAGFAASGGVAAAGRRTALVDHGPIGGLCSLNGCNPKKALVRSSEIVEAIRHAGVFGVDVPGYRIDWSAVLARKESLVSGVTATSEEALRRKGIDLITGPTRFVGPNRIMVGEREIEAEGFVIATGSTPRPLTFSGGDLARISDDLLRVRELPCHLFCIGAGVVSFELGHAFARMGCEVTILAPDARPLGGNEEDLVDALVEASRALGIRVLLRSSVERASATAEGTVVECLVEGEPRRFTVDFLLNAAGRIPSIDGLGLEAAGVQRDVRGVVVDSYLRSPGNRRVFAAGDAHGRLQLSPTATMEGELVARNFLEGDVAQVDYRVIPRAIFTLPPLASVGLTEVEARRDGHDVDVIAGDMREWKVYAIAGEETARAKVIVHRGSGMVLGAHILGEAGAEMIHLFAMAMKFGIKAAALKELVYVYPTFSSVMPSLVG